MTEYIDRKEALNFPFANGIYDHDHANEHFISGCKSYREWLSQIPAADVVERKTGKWIHLGGDEWCCSSCGYVITTEGSWEHPIDTDALYCKHCGAKMEGSGDV